MVVTTGCPDCNPEEYSDLEIPAGVPLVEEHTLHLLAGCPPASLDFYTGDGIPGWDNSFLMPTLKHGTLYLLPLLEGDGSTVDGALPLFTTVNRYRDTAISADGDTIFVATDSAGLTRGADGAPTTELANPGSILTFRYSSDG